MSFFNSYICQFNNNCVCVYVCVICLKHKYMFIYCVHECMQMPTYGSWILMLGVRLLPTLYFETGYPTEILRPPIQLYRLASELQYLPTSDFFAQGF